MRLVVVDDGLLMRKALKKILENHGFEVVAEGRDGHEAIDLYKKYKPDIITLDVRIPELDGIQVLKTIMKMNPKAKVVMISSVIDQKLIRDSIFYGAKHFITKPFDPNRVIDIVERVFEEKNTA